MESSPDWSSAATDSSNHSPGYSIVHSSPFTFLVGPNHDKLTIQSGLARHVSQPLDHLMNNGLTRESKHHIAVLEDEDVETFVAFCEYAYTGDYSVPTPGSLEGGKEEASNDPAFNEMFSNPNPFASAVPPPAPSPPPSAKLSVRNLDVPDRGDPKSAETTEESAQPQREGTTEELVQPQKEGESVKDANDDVGEDVAAPDDPPQDLTSTCDEPSEQPLATSAAEEGFLWGLDEDATPSKGKKVKKPKKGKKKQQGGATAEEPMSNLTPPTTPPPGNPNDQIDNELTVETTAMLDDPIQVTEPTKVDDVAEVVEVPEPTGADQSPDAAVLASDTESWDQATSVPPNVKDTLNEELALDHDSQKQDKVNEEVVSPRSQMKSFIDTSFAKQLYLSRRPTGVGLWDEFVSLDYFDHPSTYGTRPLTPTATHSDPSKSDLPYLIFHAKLYVFAVRYLIPALAQLCLRKLHADLLRLAFPGPKDGEGKEERAALTATKARMVLDLLHFTFTKTTRLEPISPTSATQLRDNELRKLVVHYAACKVRELAEYCPPMESMVSSPFPSPVDKRPRMADRPSSRGFRALLDSTTELASDLVFRMM
ncbi:uncharacterized protein P174DRAFT_394826 [Aspergillus novofumigatus IBT 16806]|uniref:BTB domain-containing protein n=1 Tax=Aspergillus novofumigatus (strain IBT 16806) TaxID=1392255 RepID=A0A2I1C014_ASPN1|nr:uncharacterized protein P174DRAFT_394826 [Aspergillus novofumigatus IBT 16806]PKX90972.1 hypothetical protein P174DRAFT_394826 [Aspergillus novofumigatus IBT 16806]